MIKTKEKSIEKYLAERIKILGGYCFKLNPLWYKGIPDRLILYRVGSGHNSYCRIAFVELKRPKGGRLSVAQKWWQKKLEAIGAEWHLLSTREEVDEFLAT